jgi:hypothetical protein
MTSIDLETHPELKELMEELRASSSVVLRQGGRVLAVVESTTIAVGEDMNAFRASLGVTELRENAVVEMRCEDDTK